MSSRDAILGAINDAPPGELPELLGAKEFDDALVDRFAAELAALGAELVSVDRLAELAGKSVFADGDVPFEYLRGITESADVWDAQVGITLADFGVAETGSIILSAGPNRLRLGSLAPPHHVAILSGMNLLPNLEAGFGILSSRTSVMITGPSRTADIEGVLVRGIHGPRQLWVVLVD